MEASRMISSLGYLGFTSTAHRAATVILDQDARMGERMNKDTIATVKSRGGHILEVSLWIHKPPALSYFCINCHRAPDSKPDDADFEDYPHMVAAEGRFLLLCMSFVSSLGEYEYFMYKKGNSESGELSSLDQLPPPSDYCLPSVMEFGIMPYGCKGQYLVAALCLGLDPLYYELYIYSSESAWTKILLENPCPQLDKVITSKVVTIGVGVIAFVDFQHGMLVCNLHETKPSAHYIPLPDPLPGNIDNLQELNPGPSTRWYRDLTCINGVLKFIEMEHHVVTTQQPKKAEPCDSDLIMSRQRKEPKLVESLGGWKAEMWSQTISCDRWKKGLVLDAADITFDNSLDLSLLSRLKGEADIDKIAFKDLYSAFPTLCTNRDNILYLMSWSKLSDPDGCMVVLDLGTKRVKAVGYYSLADHCPSVKAFGPFPVYYIPTGKVSASGSVRVKQVYSFAREPNNTSICVDHLSLWESDNKRPRLLAEKVNHGHNKAQNIGQTDHISLVRPAQ